MAANLFDLLDLAYGESGAAAVSVLVTKKKAEAAAAEAAARAEAEAEAARLAAKEARRAAAEAKAKAYAVGEIRRSRAVKAGLEALPAGQEVKYNGRELAEIAAAIEAAEREAEQEEQLAPQKVLSYYELHQKQKEKKQVVDEQIHLVKEQSKLLEQQGNLLEKQRKLSEENTEDVYSEAQVKLEEEQRKLAEEQNRLSEELQKMYEKRKNMKDYLGELDVKYRGKELYEAQTKFREDQNNYLYEKKKFLDEQRGLVRQGGGDQDERNQPYHGGNENGHRYNGGYERGNDGNGHYYNTGHERGNSDYRNAGYGRGNGNDRYYNRNGGYKQYENKGLYQIADYSQGYAERQTEGGEYYNGQKQGYRGGKARRQQNWQPRQSVSDAGTDAEQKTEAMSDKAADVEVKAVSVGDAASVSEPSTSDAAKKPSEKEKVKRNGSQKRKQKRDGSKKDGGNETEKTKEDSAAEPKTYFEEEKNVTLEEYEKVRDEKKKSLEVTATVVRTISAEEFKGLQLLEKKKADEEEAIKKVKPKEKMLPITEGGAGKKPDAKMVANTLFKHAPRPRPPPIGRYYSSDSLGSENGRGTQNKGGRGDGAPRGGYNGRDNGRFQGGRGNGRFQQQQDVKLDAADFPVLGGTTVAPVPTSAIAPTSEPSPPARV